MQVLRLLTIALPMLAPGLATAQATPPARPELPGQSDAPHPADTNKVIPEKVAPDPRPGPSTPPITAPIPPARDGVITPPVGIDPEMNRTPRPSDEPMPVIPPPATDSGGGPVDPR